MSLKNLQWLEGELPKLVERDIISSQQQSAITEFYEKDKKGTASIALIAFSIFGAILLGSGIILILAHNWSELSRPARTVLAFLPLVVGQAIGFWTVLKRRSSVAWCEGIAAFIFLAIGSTIALISQTYHIEGELSSYILTCMILSIPLAYIFSSTTVSVFYLMGISSWLISVVIAGSSPMGYWILLGAILPMLFIKTAGGSKPIQATVIGWFLCISMIVGVTIGYNSITKGSLVISFISLFLIFYIIGNLFDSGRSIWSNPFHRVGIIGLAATYLFLSYRGIWDMLSYNATTSFWNDRLTTQGDWIISIGLPVIAAFFIGLSIKRKNWISLGIAFGLPLAFLGFKFTNFDTGQTIFTVLFNLYVFAGGIAYMVMGIRSNEVKTVNFGFALVAAVIFLRYFDTDLSFVLRGTLFVILGIGFLLTNKVIAKRRRQNKN